MGAKILYGALIGLLFVLELATARFIAQQRFLNDIPFSNNVRSSYGFYAPDEANIRPNFMPYPYSTPRRIESVKQTTPIELHFRIELPDIKVQIVKDEQQNSWPGYTPVQQPYEINHAYNDGLEYVKRAENFRFTDIDSIPNYMQKPIAFSFENHYTKPEFSFDTEPSNNKNIYDQMIVENFEREENQNSDDEGLENLKNFFKLIATVSEGDDETNREYKPTNDSSTESNEKTDETLDNDMREINYEDEIIKQLFRAPEVKILDYEIIRDDNDDDKNEDSSESDEDKTTDNTILTSTVGYEPTEEAIDNEDEDDYHLGNRVESQDSTTIAAIESESEEPLPEVVKEINFDSKNIYKVVQPENENEFDEDEGTPTIHLINEDASQADSTESNEKTAEPTDDKNNFYYNTNLYKGKKLTYKAVPIKDYDEINRVESKEDSKENEDKSDEKLSNQWKELDSDYEEKLIEATVNEMLAASYIDQPEAVNQMYEMPLFNYMDYE